MRTEARVFFALLAVTATAAARSGQGRPRGAGKPVPNRTLEACVRQQASSAPWLFVRGLHHSGTTLLAKLLALHPAVAPLSNGGRYEDEGQHLQEVYPSVGRRSPERCGGDVYRCPAMGAGSGAKEWARLCRAWLPFAVPPWPLEQLPEPPLATTAPGFSLRGSADATPVVVLEKDPDLTVRYLAAVAGPSGGRLVLAMRHPLLWYFNFGKGSRATSPLVPGGSGAGLSTASSSGAGQTVSCRVAGAPRCAQVWFDVWGRAVLDLAVLPPAWRWAVLRFEALAGDPHAALRQALPLLGLDPAAFPFHRVRVGASAAAAHVPQAAARLPRSLQGAQSHRHHLPAVGAGAGLVSAVEAAAAAAAAGAGSRADGGEARRRLEFHGSRARAGYTRAGHAPEGGSLGGSLWGALGGVGDALGPAEEVVVDPLLAWKKRQPTTAQPAAALRKASGACAAATAATVPTTEAAAAAAAMARAEGLQPADQQGGLSAAEHWAAAVAAAASSGGRVGAARGEDYAAVGACCALAGLVREVFGCDADRAPC